MTKASLFHRPLSNLDRGGAVALEDVAAGAAEILERANDCVGN